MKKLYIITRSDLTPGQQLAQSIHASILITKETGDTLEFKNWYINSNTVVCLATSTEKEMINIFHMFKVLGIDWEVFTDPDIENGKVATAMAAILDENIAKYLKELPLALKNCAEISL